MRAQNGARSSEALRQTAPSRSCTKAGVMTTTRTRLRTWFQELRGCPAETLPTFYYARVIETPNCRWSWRDCLALPISGRPAIGDDLKLPRTITERATERAWTSPI